MNSSPTLTLIRSYETRPWLRWALTAFVAALVILFISGPARAQTLTYSTDWMGNTFSGTNNSHVPSCESFSVVLTIIMLSS